MARKEQRQRQPREEDDASDEEAATATPDLRDEQLDEDVACCLAEIDEVLASTQSERDTAKTEFQEIADRYNELEAGYKSTEAALIVWQAKYAHLGLGYDWYCCGGPYVTGDDGCG
jgi:Pup-like protein